MHLVLFELACSTGCLKCDINRETKCDSAGCKDFYFYDSITKTCKGNWVC